MSLKLIFATVVCILCSVSAFAQPGYYGVIVNVVDEKGEPVRGAWVKIVPRRNGTRSIVERSFLPTDASYSIFAATIVGRAKGELDVEATAEGFDPLTKTIFVQCCNVAETFSLKRNGQPRPEFPPLVILRGRLTNNFGEPMIGIRVRDSSGGEYFYADSDAKGNYTVRVTPGSYRVEFWPSSCTRYTLDDYVIGAEGKTLDIVTECKYRRGEPGTRTNPFPK